MTEFVWSISCHDHSLSRPWFTNMSLGKSWWLYSEICIFCCSLLRSSRGRNHPSASFPFLKLLLRVLPYRVYFNNCFNRFPSNFLYRHARRYENALNNCIYHLRAQNTHLLCSCVCFLRFL
jgi:hypothetical protein